MEMLYDRLLSANKKAQSLKRKLDQVNNAAQEKSKRILLQNYVIAIKAHCSAIEYREKELGCKISEDSRSQMTVAINKAKSIANTETLDDDSLIELKDEFDKSIKLLQSEWKVFYTETSNSLVSILDLVGGLEKEKVDSLKIALKKGEVLSFDLDQLKAFKNAKDGSMLLINSMDLDDEIKNFLRKVSSGKATLADVNNKIIKWSLEKGLASKLRLSFYK